jgi:DNA-binding NarL/FixJ family response regulator
MCAIKQYSHACIASLPRNLHNFKVKKILIADDSVSVRYVIRTFLKDVPDVEICGEAANGLDAIEKAKKLEPDLVLLDLSMPMMNGAEVASVLKKNMPDVPIILFTMYSENVGKSLVAALGVDAVLSKPDGMTQLVATVKSTLAASA